LRILGTEDGITGRILYFLLSENNANFRGESVMQFIEPVRRQIRRPITLLSDRILIHRANPVAKWLAKHLTVVVEPFPPHALQLNPVDNVWSYIKYDRLPNYTPRDLSELRERITAELSRLQKRPDLLKAFFEHTGLSLGPNYRKQRRSH